jgi:hypothetical protein
MAYPDKNVLAVVKQLEERMERGYNKYGITTADDTKTDLLGWIQHAQEEAMDLCVYIERLKPDIIEFLEWKKSVCIDQNDVAS